MKTRLTTLDNASRTLATTEPVSGSKPVLAPPMRLLWAAALALPVFGAQAGAVLTSLHSFQVFPDGKNPPAALVQGNDGNFYGTTQCGGTNGGYGTVFRISTNGALSSLYSFTGGIDGDGPNGLAQGNDGYLYGTTTSGGTNVGWGTVFRISTAGVLTTLHLFSGGSDGGSPNAALVQGNDGNFYGTTGYGGMQFGDIGYGTVYKISPNGVLTSLYSFTGGSDGALPGAALVQGNDGNFYGTTFLGGTHGQGTVFKISSNGALSTLYSFTGGNDGGSPSAALVQGNDGNFYGTTYYGGSKGGWGTVFKITANGAFTSLYSFTAESDGANPSCGLVQGSDGNFYGTTWGGGMTDGSVFKITTNGALSSLHSFTGGNDGCYPEAGLVQGSDGDFYGTTYEGGTNDAGSVFKITPSGVLTSLYSFTGENDGASPEAGLVQGSDGNFYGTTYGGGADNSGTVFKITTNGTLTTLYSFTGGNDGANPQAGLVQDSGGNLYGTTSGGGTNGVEYGGYGIVFKISPTGALSSLYSFTGGNDGGCPRAALVRGTDGNFYGTTCQGGTHGQGTVFKMTVNGALGSLHSFTGGNDGGSPEAPLVQGTDGSFYGTTSSGGTNGGWGTLFRISATGALSSLYSFTGGNDGGWPRAPLVQGTDGNFYGTAYNGGSSYGETGSGILFKISASGVLTTLYSFTGGNDGANPSAGFVQGSDGNFYGTTASGGAYTNHYGQGHGTLFKISTNGAFASLHSFTGGNDGGSPEAALVQGTDGNFYGTTYGGGQGNVGTVFRLAVPPLQRATATATATATLVDGSVVGATITDGGFGYTNTPGVRIIGGGGSGAQAVAVLTNGAVIAVNILDAGDGYTNTPVIVIAPPFIPQPTMGVAALSLLGFTNLALGTNYQLQSLSGGTWFNVGAAFTAASSNFTQYIGGTAGPNGYRLATAPAPLQACATAQMVNGFVVGAALTSGGSGYTTNPAVTILNDGAGSNATATATVSGGGVTAITITSAGGGYTNGATIIIAPPPATALWPNSVTQVMELGIGSLAPYDNYQLQFAPAAGGTWSDLGIPFTPVSATSTQYFNVSGNGGFFRVGYVP